MKESRLLYAGAVTLQATEGAAVIASLVGMLPYADNMFSELLKMKASSLPLLIPHVQVEGLLANSLSVAALGIAGSALAFGLERGSISLRNLSKQKKATENLRATMRTYDEATLAERRRMRREVEEGMPDLTTPAGVAAYMEGSISPSDWNERLAAVQRVNGGRYPSFWFSAVIESGAGSRAQRR